MKLWKLWRVIYYILTLRPAIENDCATSFYFIHFRRNVTFSSRAVLKCDVK